MPGQPTTGRTGEQQARAIHRDVIRRLRAHGVEFCTFTDRVPPTPDVPSEHRHYRRHVPVAQRGTYRNDAGYGAWERGMTRSEGIAQQLPVTLLRDHERIEADLNWLLKEAAPFGDSVPDLFVDVQEGEIVNNVGRPLARVVLWERGIFDDLGEPRFISRTIMTFTRRMSQRAEIGPHLLSALPWIVTHGIDSPDDGLSAADL